MAETGQPTGDAPGVENAMLERDRASAALGIVLVALIGLLERLVTRWRPAA